jgi:hypothetical protein
MNVNPEPERSRIMFDIVRNSYNYRIEKQDRPGRSL